MKILNSITRDTESPIQKTPVSELRETSELKDESLLHIIQYIAGTGSDAKYESMKLNIHTFKSKIYESVNNTLKTAYISTHKHDTTNVTFGDMVKYLDSINGLNNPDGTKLTYPSLYEPDHFVKHVNYDFEILRRFIKYKNQDFQYEIDTINNTIDLLDCYFSTSMELTTTDNRRNISHKSVTNDVDDNSDFCQMEIKDGNKISNEWVTPIGGNLVIYGWLDSSACLNSKAIQSAYCVLEAKIRNSQGLSNTDTWEIISIQPVIPAKSITYVGFNVMVHSDLTLRVRTGFAVGAKSGQYPNEQDGYDSLANKVANGFKCQIFSKTLTQKDETK